MKTSTGELLFGSRGSALIQLLQLFGLLRLLETDMNGSLFSHLRGP